MTYEILPPAVDHLDRIAREQREYWGDAFYEALYECACLADLDNGELSEFEADLLFGAASREIILVSPNGGKI